MEQADRGTSRSQHVLHVAPRSTVTLERTVIPALERVEPDRPAVQALVIVPDAETALLAGETVHAVNGAQGIELVPLTAVARAARLLGERPAHAIAAPATVLQALLQRSALKLDAVRTVILAWPDDPAAATPDADAALESVLAELPRDATRIMLARRVTPRIDELIERYMRNARRLSEPPVDGATPGAVPALRYVVAPRAARPGALRQLLDELDPPSVAIMVRTARAAGEVDGVLARLGYRAGAASPLRVVHYGDPAPAPAQTVILYDAPADPGELASPALADAVQVVALAAPHDVPVLRDLVPDAMPLPLPGTLDRARAGQRATFEALEGVITREYPAREMLALHPLLERHDALEIAAAALRLLEREREHRDGPPAVAPSPRPSPRAERAPADERGGGAPPRRPRGEWDGAGRSRDDRGGRSAGRPGGRPGSRDGGPGDRPRPARDRERGGAGDRAGRRGPPGPRPHGERTGGPRREWDSRAGDRRGGSRPPARPPRDRDAGPR